MDKLNVRQVAVTTAAYAFAVGFLCGYLTKVAEAAEPRSRYDERKATVLAERREVRRATERAHEACLKSHRDTEKCLAVGYETGRKRLAEWRNAGHNPHAFSFY